MVLSTEIPNAIEKTSTVEGLIGIPKYPINEAVIKSGIKLGIIDITTISQDENIHAINKAITIIAINKLVNRLFVRYLLP